MDQATGGQRVALRVGRNAVARLSTQVGGKVLSLVLVALIARHEGSAGLGRYVLVTTVVGLAAATTDVGLSIFLTREVARARSSSRRRDILGNLFSLRLGLAMLGAGVLIGLAWGPFLPAETGQLIAMGAFSLLPRAAMGLLGGFVNGYQRMDVTSAIEMTVHLLTLAGAAPALAADLGIPGVLVSKAAADAVGVLIYGAALRSWRLLPRLHLAPSVWRHTLSEAYPFAMTGIIAMAYRRLDVVLLSVWQGAVAAGEYGAAYKLWETLGLIPASLLDAMFPEMARLAQRQTGRSQLRGIRRRAGPLLAAAGLVLSAVSTTAATVLVPLVYGRANTHSGAIAAFRLQVWAVPAMFLYLLNGHALYAVGRQRWVTAAMAITGLANVGLNLLIIPRWGVLGVSAVALFSAWLLWALLASLARRALKEETR